MKYETNLGFCVNEDSLETLKNMEDGSINLLLTSPPFSNQRKKKYDSFDEVSQDKYVDWLMQWMFAVKDKLADDGSVVIDIRSAYEAGHPVESLYVYEFILKACKEAGFVLCQNVMWNNPSALPLPIQYVNINACRLKNSLNFNLWFSKNKDGRVKANNKNVLVPYSSRMQDLIDKPESFIKGDKVDRPSGNTLTIKSWQKDNGGAKASNLLNYPNSESNGSYLRYCKLLKDKYGIKAHPARYPSSLVEFWIKFLTDEDDLVFDPFSGSGTTLHAAERLGRRWVGADISREYVATSCFRFVDSVEIAELLYQKLMNGEDVKL